MPDPHPVANPVQNPLTETGPAHGAANWRDWLVVGLWLAAMTAALGWFEGRLPAAPWCRTPPAAAASAKNAPL